MSVRHSFTAIAVVVLALGATSAGAEAGLLGLQVTDKGKQPIPGATVVVRAVGGDEPVAQGMTDATGAWQAEIAIGGYSVTVSLAGFESQTQLLEIRTGSKHTAPEPSIFRLKLAKPIEVITIDDTCALDHLRDSGSWQICGRDLQRIPGQ